MTIVARVCSVESCEKPYLAKNFCAAHYRRHRAGLPMELTKRVTNKGEECSWDWCNRPAQCLGLCGSHYSRHLLGQNMDAPFKPWGSGSCTHPGCDRKYSHNGFCEVHARRFEKGTDMDAPVRSAGQFTSCQMLNCKEPHESTGLCANHARTARNYKLTGLQLFQMYLLGCQICGGTERLHIDHDHSCCKSHRNSCGKCIRGVLCGPCNNGLGHFKDDPDRLASAIRYLNRDISNCQSPDKIEQG